MAYVNSMPTAKIAVDKNVLKHYSGKVYLNDGNEFEVELFNPTSDTICAELFLNDQKEFDSVLVLKPGERVFLSCNPENKRKFKFEIYNVSGTNKQVQEAIKNNGKVEVKFYKEKKSQPTYNPPITIQPQKWWNQDPNWIGDQFLTTCNSTLSSPIVADQLEFEFDNPTAFGRNLSSTRSREVETGRVEQGTRSNQDFVHVDKEFEHWPLYTEQIQILPISQKQHTTSSAVRQYCHECGSRIRKSGWKFCPSCGERLN